MSFPLSRIYLAVVIGTSTLLNGCVSPQESVAISEQLDSTKLGLSESPSPFVEDRWWQAFDDPQLNQIVEASFANNPTLNQALARVKSAQASMLSSGASLRPDISINSGVSYGKNVAEFKGWTGNLTADLAWNLDIWGRYRQALAQTEHLANAAMFDVATARLALAGSIAQAYANLNSAYHNVEIAQRSEAQRKHILAITQNRVKAGLDTQIELKTAEAALPQARSDRLQAELQRDMAIHSLAALSGKGAKSYADYIRPHINISATLPLPSTLTLDLLARRPDVLAAKARVEAATAGKASAKAAFYPDLSLQAFVGYGAESHSFGDMFDQGSEIFGVGPALHLPIFQANALQGSYLAANADVDAAIADYNAIVLAAIQEAADRLSQYNVLTAQQQEIQQTLDATETAFTLAQKRYKAGLTSQLTVLNAETNMLNAHRSMVSVSSQLLTTRVALILTLGGSFATQELPLTQTYSTPESAQTGASS